MGDQVWTVVAAFVGGGAGAAVVGWPVEKAREKRAGRRALLAEWRAGIAAWERSIADHDGNLADLPHPGLLTREPWFKSLAANMSPEVLAEIRSVGRNGRRMHVLVGPPQNYYARLLDDEVTRLAKKWRLQ